MLKVKLNSPVPIYEQLITGIKSMIQNGELSGGDELPTMRSLASQLEIAVNTVARAYNELERAGYIESNGRKGTFVRESVDRGLDSRDKIFKSQIIQLLKSGLGESEIRKIFDSNIQQIFN